MNSLISNLPGAKVLSKSAQKEVSGGGLIGICDWIYGCCSFASQCGNVQCWYCSAGHCMMHDPDQQPGGPCGIIH
ncbi:MAG: hypothetical protein HEP71_21970 [Roseivirga sp.]|nr:hypothetical protein [Roseivirga sp.]